MWEVMAGGSLPRDFAAMLLVLLPKDCRGQRHGGGLEGCSCVAAPRAPKHGRQVGATRLEQACRGARGPACQCCAAGLHHMRREVCRLSRFSANALARRMHLAMSASGAPRRGSVEAMVAAVMTRTVARTLPEWRVSYDRLRDMRRRPSDLSIASPGETWAPRAGTRWRTRCAEHHRACASTRRLGLGSASFRMCGAERGNSEASFSALGIGPCASKVAPACRRPISTVVASRCRRAFWKRGCRQPSRRCAEGARRGRRVHASDSPLRVDNEPPAAQGHRPGVHLFVWQSRARHA